jgi:hypothetical protein
LATGDLPFLLLMFFLKVLPLLGALFPKVFPFPILQYALIDISSSFRLISNDQRDSNKQQEIINTEREIIHLLSCFFTFHD